MPQGPTFLETLAHVDAVVEESFAQPVLIFKHSLTCGMSARAYREFEALLGGDGLPVKACVVQIQKARQVSNSIAERFDIRHESPQALLLMNGAVVWHASHGGITRKAMASAIECQPAANI